MKPFTNAKLFGIKALGKGCRFGIKINSKKQDGTYTRGVFLNCKYSKEMLSEGIYTLDGFFSDNEYNDTNTLEFIVMEATLERGVPSSSGYDKTAPKPMPKSELPPIDDECIPF